VRSGPNRQAAAISAVAVLLLVGIFPAPAAAGRLDALKRKLGTYLSRQQTVRKDLREIKTEQREARGKLTAAQQDLERAERELAQVQAQLAQTKKQVAEAERRLAEAKVRLAEQQDQMWERLLTVYRSGEPSYLEVIFQATTFEEFANRAEFTRRIAQRDESLLAKLVSEKQAVAREKAELEGRKAQQTVLEAQVREHHDVIATRKAESEQALRSITEDRAEAERQLALMEREYDRIARELAALSRRGGQYQGSFQGGMLRPVSGGVVTSRFGWRIHPTLKIRKMHCGIDIAGLAVGTPIKAAADGAVIFAGWSRTAGKMVRIDHGSGMVTLYAHLSKYAVKKGQVVKAGQVIGYLGGTGAWSTGPHLHFGVCQNGKWLNPERFVRF